MNTSWWICCATHPWIIHETGQLLDNKHADPRPKPSALSEGPIKDPRLKKTGESSANEAVKPIDPRLQRTVSENASSHSASPGREFIIAGSLFHLFIGGTVNPLVNVLGSAGWGKPI
jgi:hypothetical protein